MKEKKEAKFPSEDIYCMLEPGSKQVLRFAVANRDKSLVTFLKSGKTYKMKKVKTLTMLRGAIDRAHLSNKSPTIYKLVAIWDERKALDSEIYTDTQLKKIVKIIAPYVQYKHQKFSIDEWLTLEKKFKDYQKEALLGGDLYK